MDVFQFAVPPEVAAFLDVDVVAGAAQDDDVADRGGEEPAGGVLEQERLVHAFFQGDDAAAAETAVGGDDQFGLAIENAVGHRLGAEAAEDDGMDRADAGAGEHGDGGFRDHGQINDDAVALLDAVAFEDVGKEADFAMELLIGEGAFFAQPGRGRRVRPPKSRPPCWPSGCRDGGPGNCS